MAVKLIIVTMLNPRQISFCREYVVEFNATQAAIRSGYSEDSAGKIGWALLQNIEICEYIAQLQEQACNMAKLNAAFVVEQWMQIATADPNELAQVQRTCCHYCHGVGFKYQWTEATYAAEVSRCIKAGLVPPDGLGGYGYDETREPVAACPECNGVGVETLRIADTRKLRGAARRLYAGAKHGKYGVEIQTRDQDAALRNLAMYLGILVDKKELSGPNGRPITTIGLKAEDLDDEQLADIIANATGDTEQP